MTKIRPDLSVQDYYQALPLAKSDTIWQIFLKIENMGIFHKLLCDKYFIISQKILPPDHENQKKCSGRQYVTFL